MKKVIANIPAVLLILALASCNLPRKATPKPVAANQAIPTATTTANPGQAPELATAATIPERLPSGYSELLRAKIASGEWTLEEGLVTLLKMIAGEITVSKASLGAGVKKAELTGIFRQAGEYLRTGTDPAAREEIARLLKVIIPSQEALERYSIPEAQASHRVPGLAAPSRQDPLACERLWASGFPDTRSPSFPCFLYDKLNIAGYTYQIYYPLAWHGDSSREPYYRATSEVIEDSISLYKTYGEVRSIYFVFNPLGAIETKPGDVTEAETGGIYFSESEGCPVIIYPSAMRYELPEYKQVLAHEIFHCFQEWNLYSQLNAPGDEGLWWVEGTAEYFSNLVYPTVNLEHQWANDFSAQSTMKPLLEMSYENFAFFQFLGNRINPEGVIAMLGSMPGIPGSAAQLAALSAVPEMDVTFEEFTRSILDHTLMDSDGQVIDLPDYFTDAVLFSDTTSKDFSGKPFVVARYQASFAHEKSFTLETRAEGDGRSSWRASGSIGGWEPFPDTVSGGCDDLPYYLYAITTTPGAEHTVTVDTTTVTDSPCDRCLIGRWEATNDSIISYMQSIVDTGGGAVPKVESASGVMFMEFESNGTGAGGYENLKVHETGAGGMVNADVIVTFEGFSSGPFTADGSALTGLSKTTEIIVKVDVSVNGTNISSSAVPFQQDDFPIGAVNPTRYTCAGDTLTMWPPSAAPGVDPIIYNHIAR